MFNSKENKLRRLESGLPDTLSLKTYNLIIGLLILYGFVLNAIIVATCAPLLADLNHIVFLIIYFVLCIVGTKLTHSQSPIVSFIGYNLIVLPIGTLLAICLPSFYIEDIFLSIIITGIVVTIMMLLSIIFPQFFSKIGLTLGISLLVTIIVEIIFILFGIYSGIIDWIIAIVFSLYIGYDWHKAQSYPKTIDNAIDSAVDIYLDIINLFIRILRIISKRDD